MVEVTKDRRLRSSEWFSGSNEVAMLHRVALRSGGHDVDHRGRRPVVGITSAISDLSPCHAVLAERIPHLVRGVEEAGGVAVPFPTMVLGEDLMKPSAMLYRNLLAMEVEEYLRAYPLDAVIVTGNCDKAIPGALMGALSADLPTLVHVGGARSPGCFRSRTLNTSEVWRLWHDRQAGRLDDAAWSEAEAALSGSRGACNVMGTSSTMALLVEALGLMLPGTALIPAEDAGGAAAALAAGRRIVELAEDDVRPSALLSEASFRNAAAVLQVLGGSTNAVIHLVALARRAGVALTLEDIHCCGRGLAVIADIEPSGSQLIQALHRDGGLPSVLATIRDQLDLTTQTVAGGDLAGVVARATATGAAIRPLADPVFPGPAIDVVYGSLAPDGAVVKVSAATPGLLRHRGPAVVFDGYHDMRRRIDDPGLPVTPESVLVLRGCGPVGAPGMPEWGMIPIPPALARAGVRDMVRITDARMSGTSFGTVVLHAAPEAAIGGPLAHVRDGDLIELDVPGRRVDLLVPVAELDQRRRAWRPPPTSYGRGWPALYRAHVSQAPMGCDLSFLEQPPLTRPHLEPPVIGRS